MWTKIWRWGIQTRVPVKLSEYLKQIRILRTEYEALGARVMSIPTKDEKSSNRNENLELPGAVQCVGGHSLGSE